MTPDELIEFGQSVQNRHDLLIAEVQEFEPAPIDNESQDIRSDGYAEAIFLRAFTSYESDMEKLFLHYVTGGASLVGTRCISYLNVMDASHARRITKAGFKFLSWAKPADIQTTAQNYIKDGWPFVDMMAANSQSLADCERVRNRIAHNSIEARQQFQIVQRNFLQTERLFSLSAGQFLRMRNARLRKLHIAHLLDTINNTLVSILTPLP